MAVNAPRAMVITHDKPHPKIVSEMLGHSTIAITLDTYSHVTPTMQREAAAAMDAVLQAVASTALS